MIRVVMSLCVCVLAGCGSPFIHSPVTGSPIQDPELAGEWTASEPLEVRATITPAGPSEPYSLTLVVHDKGEFKTALTLELSLTRMDGETFADLFLSRTERDKLVNSHGFLVIPVHQVLKMSREGDTLIVRQFQGDFLRGQAGGGARHDRVAVGGGEVTLITAPPEDLRDLLSRNAKNSAAFGDPIVFRRVSP
ncbi:MAG: hypothetical protein KF678_00935 [Phycisphaeraceae bacterium]|nr:hypothetical protein [Phycisphaeraceae bacterium]